MSDDIMIYVVVGFILVFWYHLSKRIDMSENFIVGVLVSFFLMYWYSDDPRALAFKNDIAHYKDSAFLIIFWALVILAIQPIIFFAVKKIRLSENKKKNKDNASK